MDDPRLSLWEPLFHHALDIFDSVARSEQRLGDWSFGGGTVLIVVERAPQSLRVLTPIFAEQRSAVLQRLASGDAALREDFAQLDVLGSVPSYDDCVARVRALLHAPGKRTSKKKSARR